MTKEKMIAAQSRLAPNPTNQARICRQIVFQPTQ
jgi:hypothetical protein